MSLTIRRAVGIPAREDGYYERQDIHRRDYERRDREKFCCSGRCPTDKLVIVLLLLFLLLRLISNDDSIEEGVGGQRQ